MCRQLNTQNMSRTSEQAQKLKRANINLNKTYRNQQKGNFGGKLVRSSEALNKRLYCSQAPRATAARHETVIARK